MIILLFLTFIYNARRTRALSFWHAFLQRLLTWSSNFKSLSIVIPRSTFFVFVSMEQPSVASVDGSLQLKRRWLLSLLAFIKLFLNHSKNFCDDVSNALKTDFLFSFTVGWYHPHSLQYQDCQGSKRLHRCILKRSGPRIDPCGTPYSMSLQELKVTFNFTLCFLFDR